MPLAEAGSGAPGSLKIRDVRAVENSLICHRQEFTWANKVQEYLVLHKPESHESCSLVRCSAFWMSHWRRQPDNQPIYGTINHVAVMLYDLVNGIPFCEINRNETLAFCFFEALRDSIDHINIGCSSQSCRISCHQTDRTCTEDSNTLSRPEARDFEPMPPYHISLESQWYLLNGRNYVPYR